MLWTQIGECLWKTLVVNHFVGPSKLCPLLQYNAVIYSIRLKFDWLHSLKAAFSAFLIKVLFYPHICTESQIGFTFNACSAQVYLSGGHLPPKA